MNLNSKARIVSKLHSKLILDTRLSVWHISLYSCLLNVWEINGFQIQISISRKDLMKKAHFGSITTYHKCIKSLVDYGYIHYLPSYDCYTGSKIEIINKAKN